VLEIQTLAEINVHQNVIMDTMELVPNICVILQVIGWRLLQFFPVLVINIFSQFSSVFLFQMLSFLGNWRESVGLLFYKRPKVLFYF
jgi:hypothetical protein